MGSGMKWVMMANCLGVDGFGVAAPIPTAPATHYGKDGNNPHADKITILGIPRKSRFLVLGGTP